MGPELTQSKRWDDLKRAICDHAMEHLRRVNLRARALEISLRRPANQAKLAITQRPKAPDSLRGEGCYMDSLQQARHAGRPIWECFKPISKPDGSPGPPSHRHADDTTPARANSRGYCLLARCGGTEHESWMSYRFSPVRGEEWPSRLSLSCGRHGHISLPATPHCMSGVARTSTQPSSPAYSPFAGLRGHPPMLARVWPCYSERQ